MGNQPQVSVVMAVHNSAPYLREALASIRWQTFQDWECIPVDDGSTDATPEILANFAAADPRFRPLRQEKSGVVAALNLGDGAARGEWIARMDSDDVMTPERLEKQLDYMERHPECVGLGGDVMLVDPSGSPIGAATHATEHEEIERRMLAAESGTLSHPTLFMRREAEVAAGGYRHQRPWAHDSDFLIRLAQVGRLANLPEVLLLYRQHPKSFCATKRARIREDLREMLHEAHAARDLVMPEALDQSLTGSRRESSPVGKWARRAARNGQQRTAWNLWRELIGTQGLTFETTRVTVEMLLRSASAQVARKKGVTVQLPDWKAWDCPKRKAAA